MSLLEMAHKLWTLNSDILHAKYKYMICKLEQTITLMSESTDIL